MSELKRRLGLWDAAGVVFSNMVGSGIFFTTGWVIASAPSAALVLLAWALGGGLALLGALSYAELACAFPRSGGEYHYLRAAFGPLLGFLSGWTSLFIGFATPCAIAALGFVAYLGQVWPGLQNERVLVALPWGPIRVDTLLALAVIGALTAMHFVGRGTDRRVQLLLSAIKLVAMGLLIALLLGSGQLQLPTLTFASARSTSLTGFFAAMVPIAFAYSGWNAATYIAGELRDPVRDLPRALVRGTLAVTALYLVINLLYLAAAPLSALNGVAAVAQVATEAALGKTGASVLSVVIALCLLGALNSMLFVGPRVLHAMALDGVFFAQASRCHKETGAPTVAVAMQSATAAMVVLLGDLRSLLEFAGFVLVLLGFLGVASVMVLRVRQPELRRPIRVPGYPLTPLLFCAFSLYLMYASFIFNLRATLLGLFVVGLGVPAYALFNRYRPSAAP